MYRTGDKILYPMHGAGIIRQIKTCEILGQTKDYYLLSVPCGNMEVMIPVDSSDDIGVRPVGTIEEIDEAVSVLGEASTEMSGNWNKRYRENMDKIKTGNILFVAEIVRNLTRIDRKSKLSAGEKKMLSNARKILVSEIMLVKDISEAEALGIIEAAI
ncbi:MAG: CarD family transcriptional regulator [Clostridia bacterium]|nr:CarD family transcriptional regulator [Clostridia bacterium]